jgi:hypothetical protein
MSNDDETVNMILGILTTIMVFVIFLLGWLIFEALRVRSKFLNLMSAMQEEYGEITLNKWINIHSSGGKGISYNEMVHILGQKTMHEIQPPSRVNEIDYDNKLSEYHARKTSHDNNILIEEVKRYAEQVYNKRMKERNTLTLAKILE